MDGKLMLNNNQIFTQEPDDPTPISEYELWVEREKEYNNIIEQLKSPFAQLVFGKDIAFILCVCKWMDGWFGVRRGGVESCE